MNKKNNKQPSVYVPTRKEFDEYVTSKMKLDDKDWADALWNLATKVGWRKKNGEAPNHWHSLVSAYNGVLLVKLGRKPHLLAKKAKIVPKHEKTIINELFGYSIKQGSIIIYYIFDITKNRFLKNRFLKNRFFERFHVTLLYFFLS